MFFVFLQHGIGYSSITIVLHEVIKLLHYARVQDPIIFRIGTSGGVSLSGGTVVIAEKAYNDFLEEFFEIVSNCLLSNIDPSFSPSQLLMFLSDRNSKITNK